MQNGKLRRQQLMASSEWDANHGVGNGRLNSKRRGHRVGAWCAKYKNYNQWLMADFGRPTRVTIISTQGRQDMNQWVTMYYITYSQDKSLFVDYKVNSRRKVRFQQQKYEIEIIKIKHFDNWLHFEGSIGCLY